MRWHRMLALHHSKRIFLLVCLTSLFAGSAQGQPVFPVELAPSQEHASVALQGEPGDQSKKSEEAKKETTKDEAKKDEKKDEAKKDEKKEKLFWELYPPVDKFPRVGLFTVPPVGEGFYSLLDCWHGEWRKAPPKYPYPRFGFMQPPFFDADWRYLENPKNDEFDCFDPLKRIHCGDWLFTTGGDFRYRYQHEQASRLTNVTNDYHLVRTRLFADLWYLDYFRAYVELIDAHSFDEDLPPLPIDRNRADLLNAFLEVKVADFCSGPVYVRAGRQELLLGSQRLISPLEWANTRRTFQGVRGFFRSENVDLDLFCVQPVIPNASHFDSVDNNQVFSGGWLTWRPKKGQNVDLYCLNLDNTNSAPVTRGIPPGPYNVTTLGARYVGQEGCWLWDFEGMLQTGSKRSEPLCAQAVSANVGQVWLEHPWRPQFWLAYDYASGDNDPAGRNTARTFNQLFPFGHYYFGYIDVVGRQNIHDFNAQLVCYPTRWITALAQVHAFRLDQPRDALYNAAGVPIRRDPTGRAGRDVGREVDLVVNFHVDKHQDVLLGYSHLFQGSFLEATGNTRDPDYFYAQYTFRW